MLTYKDEMQKVFRGDEGVRAGVFQGQFMVVGLNRGLQNTDVSGK